MSANRRAIDKTTPVGKLVRGRHEGGARPRRRGDADVDAQAFGVDRDRLQHGIRQHELASRQEIAGILHPHPVARRQQHADRDVDRLLGAGGDDDLLGIRAHPARRLQILGDGAAQLDEAARIGIAEMLRAERAHRAMRELAPDLDGARIDERAPGVERPFVGLRRRRREFGEGARRCRRRRRAPQL
jgi:hypothetical protein